MELDPAFYPVPGKKHPKELGAPEVRAFLTHLAADKDVAVSTQAQALNALVFSRPISSRKIRARRRCGGTTFHPLGFWKGQACHHAFWHFLTIYYRFDSMLLIQDKKCINTFQLVY